MLIKFYIIPTHNPQLWKGVYENRGHELAWVGKDGRTGTTGTYFLNGQIEIGKMYLTKIRPQ